jgi:lactate permease
VLVARHAETLRIAVTWIQLYDPLGSFALSTLAAAVPIALLLVALGVLQWPAWRAALAGLVAALAVAIGVYGMPPVPALAAAAGGAAYGVFPIGWIIVAAVFLYDLTVRTGHFDTIRQSVARLSADRRVQALLIAFSFGAFLEGAAGFGTPVAISAALMMGLGFAPLAAASLALIANTAPVAFGAIGTPILTLAAVTGLPATSLSAMAGRQLPFVSLIVPAWLVVTMSGWRGLAGVWPAVVVSGGTFALVQFGWSNFVGPELVDIAAGLSSLVALAIFSAWWRPSDVWDFPSPDAFTARPVAARVAGAAAPVWEAPVHVAVAAGPGRRAIARAWTPWIFLSLAVAAWGFGPVKALLAGGPEAAAAHLRTGRPPAADPWLSPSLPIPTLDRAVYRDYPVEPRPVDRARANDPAYRAAHAEAARFSFNWLGATGTAILFAAVLSSLFLGIPARTFFEVGWRTLRRMLWPLAAISLMLALGYVTHYGGSDATLGLAFTRTGVLYPFFAALLGWLGVALTGSDTSSNVLFGSLQKITAQQLGLNPVLITASNSTGGVMGKMIAAQSIVVATTAANQQGQEGRLLRRVFWHSLALASLMGAIVLLQAYVFKGMVPGSR